MRATLTLGGLAVATALTIFGPAQAQTASCPTAESATYSLVSDQPYRKTTVQRVGNLIVGKNVTVSDGVAATVNTQYTRGLLPVVQHDGKGIIKQQFGPVPAEFWTLSKGQEVTIPVTVDLYGKQTLNGTHRMAVQSIRTIAVGTCTYDVALILQVTAVGNTQLVFLSAYSPVLNFVIASQQIDPETGKQISGVQYDRVEAGG